MNLIGESFDGYVATQVKLRQKFYGSSNTVLEGREQYLYNKQPFAKLVSSVDIAADKLKKLGLPESLAGENLAKSFVLFAGTSEFQGQTNGGQDVFNLRAGLNNNQAALGNSAYGLGGLEFGQVPMPGITSVNVSYKNRGSLKTATIQAKAYNRTQLNIIDALYLRLGYTVLLEWGWGANFLNNNGEVVPQITRTLANDFLNGSLDSGNILPKIGDTRENFSGNYDALYGKVTNFNWSFNPDGTYDISINLVSVGDIIESLTINDITGEGTVLTLDNFTTKIEEFKDELKTILRIGKVGENTIQVGSNSIKVILNFNPREVTTPEGKRLYKRNYYEDENIINYFTSQTGLVSATPITGSNITSPSGVVAINAGLNSLTYFLYTGIQLPLDTNSITLTKRAGQSTSVISVLKDGNSTSACRINWEGKSEANYYIKFGTLLRWIQDNLIFNNVNGDKKTKALTFDLSISDNLIYKNKYSVATDYTKVITRNVKFPDLSTPDSTDTIDLLELPSDVEFTSDKNPNAGKLMNVFLNLSWLVETLKSNIDSEGNISLFSFLQGICQGINSSLGYVNSIDVIVDEETNTIKFIDDKPIPGILEDFNLNNTPTEFQVYAFSPTGSGLNGSFIRDFSIRTEVSNKLSTTLAIGAQAVNAVVTENATALQSWNEGLTDRTAKIKEDSNSSPKTTPTPPRIELGVFSTNIATSTFSPTNTIPSTQLPAAWSKYESDVKNYVSLLKKYDDKTLSKDELDQINTLNKNWQKFWSQTIAEAEQKASPSGVGFIPINLNLTMDGLSGMKIYQTFTIDSKFLPLNYPDKLQFLVKGVSHTISKEGWTTQIESLSIPKDITQKDPISNVQPNLLGTEERITEQITGVKLNYEVTNPLRRPIKELTFSNNALTLIKRFEGLRLKAYQPIPGDRWTIGYGNTFYKNGKAVQKGDVLSSEKIATELLRASVTKFENSLKANLPSSVRLNQNEYDALISFSFNVGTKWSKDSTLRNLLTVNNYTAASNKLLDYSFAQGKQLKGLLRRRQTERDLFLRT
jgi:lysozyme